MNGEVKNSSENAILDAHIASIRLAVNMATPSNSYSSDVVPPTALPCEPSEWQHRTGTARNLGESGTRNASWDNAAADARGSSPGRSNPAAARAGRSLLKGESLVDKNNSHRSSCGGNRRHSDPSPPRSLSASSSSYDKDMQLRVIDEVCRNLSFISRRELSRMRSKSSRSKLSRSSRITRRRRRTHNTSYPSLRNRTSRSEPTLSRNRRILSSLKTSSTSSETSSDSNIDRINASSTTIMNMMDEYPVSMLPVEKIDDIIVNSLEPIYNIPSIGVKNIIQFHEWWRKFIHEWITNHRHLNLGWRHLRLMIEQTTRQSSQAQNDSSSSSKSDVGTATNNDNDNKKILEDNLLSWIVEHDIVFVGLSKSSSSLSMPKSSDDDDSINIEHEIKTVFNSLTNDYFNEEFFLQLASYGLLSLSSSSSSPSSPNNDDEDRKIDSSSKNDKIRQNTVTALMA